MRSLVNIAGIIITHKLYKSRSLMAKPCQQIVCWRCIQVSRQTSRKIGT